MRLLCCRFLSLLSQGLFESEFNYFLKAFGNPDSGFEVLLTVDLLPCLPISVQPFFYLVVPKHYCFHGIKELHDSIT